MVYLFIGEDSFSKDIKLKKIKEEFLAQETEQFNLDVLYGQDLNLKTLQEKLLNLPFPAKKRIVVVKNGLRLKEEIKEFLLGYVRNPYPRIVLILDLPRYNPKDKFIKGMTSFVRIIRFREEVHWDTFTLCRAIGLRKADYSLNVLKTILAEGEKPEQIIGGLRYVWEKDITRPGELKKKLRLLLNCDIDIKTGRLKPQIALERLVANLCCL